MAARAALGGVKRVKGAEVVIQAIVEVVAEELEELEDIVAAIERVSREEMVEVIWVTAEMIGAMVEAACEGVLMAASVVAEAEAELTEVAMVAVATAGRMRTQIALQKPHSVPLLLLPLPLQRCVHTSPASHH